MIPVKDAKQKLLAAMAAAVAKGWRIERGITIAFRSHECCPLGAFYVAERDPDSAFPGAYTYCAAADRHLGMTMEEATAFATGFDGRGMPAFSEILPSYVEAHALGASLALERFSHQPRPL